MIQNRVGFGKGIFSLNLMKSIITRRVYLLSFRTTSESKLREFPFKALNRIGFTNEELFRFDMTESDKCAFCQVESIEHLLFFLQNILCFWNHVLSWLRDNNIIVENVKEEDIIFGNFDVGDDFLLINHIFYCLGSAIFIRKNVGYVGMRSGSELPMIGPWPCAYASAYVYPVFTNQSYDISIRTSTRKMDLSVFLVFM